MLFIRVKKGFYSLFSFLCLFQKKRKKTKTPKAAKSQNYHMNVKTTPTKASILPTYVAFGDITEALKQGITGLKLRSYDNTMEFNSIINTSLKKKHRTDEFDDTNLVQNLSIDTTNSTINYTSINKIRNIDPITIDYLNNTFFILIGLHFIFQFKNYFSLIIKSEPKEIIYFILYLCAFKLAPWLWLYQDLFPT